jgi:hypothetical protein
MPRAELSDGWCFHRGRPEPDDEDKN